MGERWRRSAWNLGILEWIRCWWKHSQHQPLGRFVACAVHLRAGVAVECLGTPYWNVAWNLGTLGILAQCQSVLRFGRHRQPYGWPGGASGSLNWNVAWSGSVGAASPSGLESWNLGMVEKLAETFPAPTSDVIRAVRSTPRTI